MNSVFAPDPAKDSKSVNVYSAAQSFIMNMLPRSFEFVLVKSVNPY